jgi:hypothetical protein
MKKLRVFVLFLAVAALTVTACKKEDDDDNGGNNGGSGTMTLKADGADFSADLAVQAVNSNGVINVTGNDGNARQCSLILYGASGPGTYDIGAANPQNLCTWTEGTGQLDSYVASFVIGSGTVTITELTDTKIKGTFSFTGFNNNQESRTITEGQFEANFN